MEAPPAEIRFLRLPGNDLFAVRAARLGQLGTDHPLGDYLAFLALLADGQQEALARFPDVALPDTREQALLRQHAMPFLAARTWRRAPAWREGLAAILGRMDGAATLPPAARETVARLGEMGDAGLEEIADHILAGDLAAVPPRELPFVAAALQVYWVHMASALGEQAFGRPAEAGVCPVCGSLPGVGIVHGSGPDQGLRYLCCTLCASQWHMVRVVCSSCQSTGGIDYYTLSGSDAAVKAESCATCSTYLKLLYLEKDDHMEAVADDLATLDLDMLMDAEGKGRRGPNLFFHPGP
jgi:FdhE protein